MPTVRYTGGGSYALRDGPTFDGETREADVPAETAAYLTDREDFEAVDGPDTCEVVTNDGEVCGRDRPCQYHD